MTATRVVVDHSELDSSGQVSHASLDAHVNTTPFVIVSGAVGNVPPSARKLAAGSGIIIADGGAGGNITISAPGAGALISWMEIPVGARDGINTNFVLSNSPSPSSALMFYVNGLLQMQGADYDYLLSGSTIQFNYAYTSGSNMVATYPY